MEVNEDLVRQNGNQSAAVMADYAGQDGGGGETPNAPTPSVFVSVGYGSRPNVESESIILTYDDKVRSTNEVIDAIFGNVQFKGKWLLNAYKDRAVLESLWEEALEAMPSKLFLALPLVFVDPSGDVVPEDQGIIISPLHRMLYEENTESGNVTYTIVRSEDEGGAIYSVDMVSFFHLINLERINGSISTKVVCTTFSTSV